MGHPFCSETRFTPWFFWKLCHDPKKEQAVSRPQARGGGADTARFVVAGTARLAGTTHPEQAPLALTAPEQVRAVMGWALDGATAQYSPQKISVAISMVSKQVTL